MSQRHSREKVKEILQAVKHIQQSDERDVTLSVMAMPDDEIEAFLKLPDEIEKTKELDVVVRDLRI